MRILFDNRLPGRQSDNRKEKMQRMWVFYGKISLFIAFAILYCNSIATAQTIFDSGLSKYRQASAPKAFVASPSKGSWAWQTAANIEMAKKGAMSRCSKWARDCRVYFVNNKAGEKLQSNLVLDANLVIVDEGGRHGALKGKLSFSNIFMKTTGVVLTIEGGQVLCRGKRTYLGDKRHSFDGECLGGKYTGIIKSTNPTIHLESKSKKESYIDVKIKY